MSAPVIDLKLRFRPGFQAEMDKGFQKVQYAFSQQVAKAVDPYRALRYRHAEEQRQPGI